ncbi:hypothetical protein Tco_1357198 [Tanacetum coccineum]
MEKQSPAAMTPPPQHTSSQSSTKPCSQEEATDKSARRSFFRMTKPKEKRRKLINKPCLNPYTAFTLLIASCFNEWVYV